MTQSRRWAAWLAAFLLAASLVAMPREGAAWTPYIDLTNPPVVDEGEPDGPPSAPSLVTKQPAAWSVHISFIQGRFHLMLQPARVVATKVKSRANVRSFSGR